jgi:hypothetical protein
MKEIFCWLRFTAIFTVTLFFFCSLANSQANIFHKDSIDRVLVTKSCFLGSDLKQNDKENHKESDLMFYNTNMDILERSRFIYYIENNFFDKKYPIIRMHENVDINEANYYKYENKNIVLTDAVLRVNKNIVGSIAVFNGRVIIDPNSGYENYIYLYNSYLQVDSSFKNFFIVCASEEQIAVFENNQTLQFKINKSIPYYIYDDLKGGVTFRYNRVEGPFFGLSRDKNFYWGGGKNYSYNATAGYAFGNHRWTGSLAFDYWMGNYDRIEFGAEIFSLTDSKDNWRIGSNENSAASFFIHEDFKDYFLREGYLFRIYKYYSEFVRFGITFIQDNYRSQQKNYDWAMLGGHKKFRANPSVENGIIRSIVFAFNYNSYAENYYLIGWDINSEFEIANGVSNYTNYNRIFLDVRNYSLLKSILPFVDNSQARFNTRLMFGTADKELPFQKSFDIGGLGTVSATSFKSLNGNKMLLANFELSYPTLELFGIDLMGLRKSVTNTIISYDFGFVYNSTSNNIFADFDINKQTVLHGVSVALGTFHDRIRLGVAFRLDKSESPRLILRLAKPF